MNESTNPPDVVNSASALDPYEAKYMNTSDVRYRSKVGGKWPVHVFSAVVALCILSWCAAYGRVGLGLVMGAAMMLGGVFLSVIRVTISSTSVDVDFGLLGPNIPLTAIDSVAAVTHRHRGLVRWGITPLGRSKWLYTIPGDKGHAVKIVWRGPNGQQRVHYIGCQDHEALAEEIRRARAQALAPALGTGEEG